MGRSVAPRLVLSLVFVVAVASGAVGQSLEIERVFPGVSFSNPVDLQNAGDGTDRLFVVEQITGRIYVFDNNQSVGSAALFLDLGSKIVAGGELGLLGLAFHPNYSQNGYFFVNYTANSPRRTVVERYRVDASNPNAADPDSSRIILEVAQPASNHNSGQLAFGPDDGMLYVSLGDGGQSPPISQDLGELLGSMLRLNVDNVTENSADYQIPADNPLVGNTNGWREEMWAYGFRNPWRFSFDDQGRLWLGDVGNGSWEEVNLVEKGMNYGWPIMEATHCHSPSSGCEQNGLTLPVAEYPHSLGRSITGGYVYQGSRAPQLVGKYLFADYVNGRVWSLTENAGSFARDELFDLGFNVSSFGRDESGEVYVVGYNGNIYGFRTVTIATDTPDAGVVVVGEPYPNPVAADGDRVVLDVTGSNHGRARVAVFDVLGRILSFEEVAVGNGPIAIELSSRLPNGPYWISVDIDGERHWRSIAVVR